MYSKFRIEAIKIAKRLGISMFLCTERIIEIAELDDDKAYQFIRAIEKLNSKTRVTDLIKNKQHIDSNGYDITGDKSKYLIDDDYYNEIIGKREKEQLSMF